MREPDPDQLLKSLDAAMAMSKARHARAANRNAFRIVSIVVLVIGTIAALALLQYMASELPAHPPAGKTTPAEGQQPK